MDRLNCLIVRSITAGLFLVVGLSVGVPQQVRAQDAAAEAFDPAQWQELLAKKAALVSQLTAMSEQLATASPEEKQKLSQEANTLQQDFRAQTLPQMIELAPAAYAANPQDVDAAEMIMQIAYSTMRFDEAAAVADTILAQQPTHQLALNIGGAANFAINQFVKSVQLLEKAQKSNSLSQMGEQYLNTGRDYVQYWQKEQLIREREAAATGDQQLPQVKMTTAKGDIVLELFENEAPNTVANFINLAEQGYYDGLKFHRVIPNFMAQGGCPNTRDGAEGMPGTGGPGYTIACEAYEPAARRHFGGTLSMAHAGKDTGGSQFFITHLPTPHLDQEINPQSVHTVFGRVAEGMDVVWSLRKDDAIEKVEVIRKRDHDYKPVTTADPQPAP